MLLLFLVSFEFFENDVREIDQRWMYNSLSVLDSWISFYDSTIFEISVTHGNFKYIYIYVHILIKKR